MPFDKSLHPISPNAFKNSTVKISFNSVMERNVFITALMERLILEAGRLEKWIKGS